MSDKMRAFIPLVVGLVGAALVAVVPEAKPLICGSVLTLGAVLVP